jgi:hypothetical protein
MDQAEAAGQGAAPGSGAKDHRMRSGQAGSIVSLAVFDVAGPLGVYYALRASGVSTVLSLVVSGVVPAVGIGLGVLRHRRVDAVGVVVLTGILVGTALGLASGSARLVLIEGTVPTAVLGIACFGSLSTSRPLMFRVALQFMGADSAQGRDFADKWRYREFRRVFFVITVVWGTAFLLEAFAQIAIIESASATVAKTTSNLMPIAVAGLLAGWTGMYGRRKRARGEAALALQAGAGSTAALGEVTGDPA